MERNLATTLWQAFKMEATTSTSPEGTLYPFFSNEEEKVFGSNAAAISFVKDLCVNPDVNEDGAFQVQCFTKYDSCLLQSGPQGQKSGVWMKQRFTCHRSGKPQKRACGEEESVI